MAIGSLGAVVYDIVAQDKTKDGVDSAVTRTDKLKDAAGKAGAAMTAMGAAMTAITQSSMKTSAELGVTALQIGVTTKEMESLALSTSNVTFPLNEVTATFDLLARAGIENKDTMADVATQFDTLGDAIGMSASEVTTVMIPAFNAFGVPLESASEHMDTFTHLARNTTVNLGDFSSMVNYLAADLDTMDMSMTESVAVMEALADRGIQGSAATREFRTAVTQADGDLDKFYAALGLTADEVGTYADEIENSTGMTQSFADAANKQYTTLDKVGHAISEATLQFGSFLQPVEALGPAMTALGPIMITMSTVQWSTLIPALTATAASVWAVLAPLLPIVAAVAAVIAVIYLLEKRFGHITKAANLVKKGFDMLVKFWKGVFEKTVSTVENIISKFGDKLLFLLGPIGAIVYAFRHWDEIKTIVTDVYDSAANKVSSALDSMKSAVTSKYNDMKTATSNALSKIKSVVSMDYETMRQTVSDKLTAMKDTVVSIYGSIYEATGGALTKIKDAVYEAHVWMFNTVKDKLTDMYNTVKTKYNDMKTEVTTRLTDMWNTLRQKYDEMSTKVKTALGDMLSTLRSKYDEMVSKVESALDTMKTVVSNVYNAILGLVTTVLGTILAVVIQKYAEMHKAVLMALVNMKNMIMNIYDGIVAMIVDYLKKIYDWIVEWFGKTVDYITGLDTDFYNAATTILGEFKQGVEDTFSDIWDSVQDWIDKIKDAISGAPRGGDTGGGGGGADGGSGGGGGGGGGSIPIPSPPDNGGGGDDYSDWDPGDPYGDNDDPVRSWPFATSARGSSAVQNITYNNTITQNIGDVKSRDDAEMITKRILTGIRATRTGI